ncbi:histidinol-phosphate transaminase [Sporosarcina sp. resist]|uniref:histidinol-phosphate transaminase n=1 Tax=Sporosarcina sp. resist TaxID=2762563 RepID=UPI00164E435D|nr:histidinol-phosphate transaminase [Sporosarcina sp. resist]QNK86560.1 histidinol-phosphate transaminase [Sporosarcina sp. resist]
MNWKKALDSMQPYKPGRSIDEAKRIYGLDDVVKLASNENPYGCAPSVRDYLTSAAIQHELYPDGYAGGLRKKLAEKHGVDETSLLFGNGSDEIIMIISRALLGKGVNTVMATPTFPQYAHNARIEGAEIREVPLKDGHHDLEGFLGAIDGETSVAWLCNPNNPTGNLIPSDTLKGFLEQVSENILVVLDEAYFEYITGSEHIDSISWLEKFPNVIILRTFSKAYGLAAFRVGYAIGDPEVISNLNKVRSPFNNNSLGLAVAEKALEDEAFIEHCRNLNHEQRLRFTQYASDNKLHLFDSETNFVLIAVPGDADDASEKLLQQGFIIRSGNALGTPGYIRVTIGSEEQTSNFLKAFDTLLQSEGSAV